ncbi:hypothetical protein, partial [Mycobacterium pseudoshottsii]|uniref:hypothetical protein n=1 Tax=Mycobacterium pseudoshottsii TaxID=265949 RepID=UPI001F32E957
FDRQPPPRPPQSTIPQLTSLLINNAGALPRQLSHLRFALRRIPGRAGNLARSPDITFPQLNTHASTPTPTATGRQRSGDY